MKIEINIEKRNLSFLSVLIGLLLIGYVVATGWTSGEPSHETLYIDTIRGKSSGTVTVNDGFIIAGDLQVDGSCTGCGGVGDGSDLNINDLFIVDGQGNTIVSGEAFLPLIQCPPPYVQVNEETSNDDEGLVYSTCTKSYDVSNNVFTITLTNPLIADSWGSTTKRIFDVTTNHNEVNQICKIYGYTYLSHTEGDTPGSEHYRRYNAGGYKWVDYNANYDYIATITCAI